MSELFDGTLDDTEANTFFKGNAFALNAYAARHRLSVQRFPQNQPTWIFSFLHPKGGTGIVQLSHTISSTSSVGAGAWISGHWYIDDDEHLDRRAFPSPPPVRVNGLDADVILCALEDHLETILKWDTAYMKEPTSIRPRPLDRSGKPRSGKFERTLSKPDRR